ncbi:MAG: acetate/propionate family kinase [Spirochaeta sp.]|nr:acetate/propionate family kinase [Spirochaeta sp.]
MRILVINSGSSSLKFQLMNMIDREILCKGLIERIGSAEGTFTYSRGNGEKIVETREIPDHETAISLALQAITDPQAGVIKDLSEIDAVGHRIVHGGEKIKKSEFLTDEIIRIIQDCVRLAPLHNPANLLGVKALKKLLPDVPHIGVFDTAFHTTMPEKAYIYPLAYEYYKKHGIRRFGFHGTSHHYVSLRAAEILGIKPDKFNCITCHFGNGVSISAIQNGKSVDTSLGFGTMAGVPMGTRAGDLDPDIILYLIDQLKMSVTEVRHLIYKNSGLKGLSGLTNDMRDIVEAALAGKKRPKLALRIFTRSARKMIGAMATVLEGKLDAIIFTAGIGENNVEVRAMVCEGLEILGARIDLQKNLIRGKEGIISTDDSRIKLMVVPTNEELMIALETEALAQGARKN